ncbi:MAG: hypothetical protein NVS1B12_02640 [Acidimicrobiales bacterium]
MLHTLHNRLARASSPDGTEDGFTLIELMVVVLIIAILIAIAIPTFLGARQKAQDRAAQSNLRNALTAAKTAYVDSQSYKADVTATPIAYQGIEPSLHFQTTPASGANDISVASTDPGLLVLAAHSASGECFFVKDIAVPLAAPNDKPGTQYSKASGSSCDAANPTGTFGPTW